MISPRGKTDKTNPHRIWNSPSRITRSYRNGWVGFNPSRNYKRKIDSMDSKEKDYNLLGE